MRLRLRVSDLQLRKSLRSAWYTATLGSAFEEAHTRLVEMVTDLAGRRAAPTQKNWGAPLSDDHNLDLEFRRRLIRHIASHIERLIQGGDCQSCWLAAPKEITHQIVQELTLRFGNA